MKVHLLATCRKPELFRATTLVFDTIRVGFPDAEIFVWNSGLPLDLRLKLADKVGKIGANLVHLASPTIHHEWIESLVLTSEEPFFICDTDMIFWKCFRTGTGPDGPGHLMGRLIPQFFDEFTNCVTRSRLHTSLLYIDPVEVRAAMERYFSQFPETPFNPRPNLFYPSFHPLNQEGKLQNFFFDTCSQLFHAIGGTPFTEEQLDCYDHLHCGTISDLVAPHLTLGRDMGKKHQLIFNNPRIAKGIWKDQDEYYKVFASNR